MRWGSGPLNWVRPLRAITATFGPETEDPEVIAFTAGDVAAGQTTYGHRFLAPAAIKVKRFDDYVASLEKAKVVLDLDRRKDTIRHEAGQLAFAQGLTLIEDEGLFEEVAGLVEWPVPMMGSFDPEFLAVPEEVIIATIRANQKCFCLRDPYGKLANKFILVANTVPTDGGATIVAGNERVIRARLSDAKFFYEQDLKFPLEHGIPKLEETVFHAKLGTQFQRVERIVKLAAEIAPLVGADVEDAKRAAMLAKADLVTGMVGEFPELQGVMGRYYALAQGEKPAVADAVAEHYKPLGPTDRVPTVAGLDRRRPRRQARPPHRLLGHRRKAHGVTRSVCAAPCRAGRDPHRHGEQSSLRSTARLDGIAQRVGMPRSLAEHDVQRKTISR